MKHTEHRLKRVVAATSGVLAAALLPAGAAFADDYDFTPNVSTFVASQVEGYPPLINVVTGAEYWNVSDLTTNTVTFANTIAGTDTQTTIGSFTNDDYLTSSGFSVGTGSDSFFAPAGTQIDL